MIEGQYPTPAQSTIFIDDIWIDDAHQVDWKHENARIPVYGYNRSQFAFAADGKELITGSIIINYRYPNYLGFAIAQALRANKVRRNRSEDSRNTQELRKARLGREELREQLRALKAGTPEDRIKRMAESLSRGTFDQLSGLSKALFSVDPDELNSTEELDPVRMSGHGGGFTVQCVYGHGSGMSIVETIRDCYITGRGKALTASAGGGGPSTSGSAIYEVYPFIAKTVDSKFVNLTERS